MAGATWIRSLLGGSARAAGLLILAHGRLIALRCDDVGQEFAATHLGTYARSDDAAACLNESVGLLREQGGGRWDIFIGADLAPCMVLVRDDDVTLAPAQWVELATVALLPEPEDEMDFVLRLSGAASDRRRIACFVPSVLLGVLRSPAILRGADIRRCEPMAALAIALGPDAAGAHSSVACWVRVRLGGLGQAVLVAPDGQPEKVSRLLTDRCGVGRLLDNGEEKLAPQEYLLDLDAMIVESAGIGVFDEPHGVEATS